MSKKSLHHGNLSQEITPRFIGTDYFTFFHIPCITKEPELGHCLITKILIDNDGRIIFNLKCRSCGFIDALKTSATLWIPQTEMPHDTPLKEIFQLSPKLKECIGHHWWDNF